MITLFTLPGDSSHACGANVTFVQMSGILMQISELLPLHFLHGICEPPTIVEHCMADDKYYDKELLLLSQARIHVTLSPSLIVADPLFCIRLLHTILSLSQQSHDNVMIACTQHRGL